MRAERYTAHSSKLAGAFVKTILHCVTGAVVVARRIRVMVRRSSAVLDHALPANSTLVDRVDLATKLSLSSRPTTGLSALAPAQRAGAQRLCALALRDEFGGLVYFSFRRES